MDVIKRLSVYVILGLLLIQRHYINQNVDAVAKDAWCRCTDRGYANNFAPRQTKMVLCMTVDGRPARALRDPLRQRGRVGPRARNPALAANLKVELPLSWSSER